MANLILPWPPSVNHYYQPAYNKRTGKLMIRRTSSALRYRSDVYHTVGNRKPMLDRLYLHIIANHPNMSIYDLDNLLKGICDSLEYSDVYKNDSQIDRIIIERGSFKKHGELIVNCAPIKHMLLS